MIGLHDATSRSLPRREPPTEGASHGGSLPRREPPPEGAPPEREPPRPRRNPERRVLPALKPEQIKNLAMLCMYKGRRAGACGKPNPARRENGRRMTRGGRGGPTGTGIFQPPRSLRIHAAVNGDTANSLRVTAVRRGAVLDDEPRRPPPGNGTVALLTDAQQLVDSPILIHGSLSSCHEASTRANQTFKGSERATPAEEGSRPLDRRSREASARRRQKREVARCRWSTGKFAREMDIICSTNNR